VDYDVLVVEDSASMRAFISSTIEELDGVRAVQAASGFEALKELPRRAFHLVITDINMPDINGLELIRFIRENDRYAKIPLIVISTEGSQRDRERGLALGANNYLVKPFDPAQLQELVTRYLKGGP